MLILSLFISCPKKVERQPLAIIIIADAVGFSYFTVKEEFTNLGWNTLTLGDTQTVHACYNKEIKEVKCDLVFTDIDKIALEDFDAIIIPAGGQHKALMFNKKILIFIEKAYKHKKIISSFCTGIKVLAKIENILKNKKVASFNYSDESVKNAQGLPVSQKVVIDDRLITGGEGGGKSEGGYLKAPIKELVEAIDQKFKE
jgi:putative intracellular protease/amidase